LVSGDIAFSGRSAEYARAESLLADLGVAVAVRRAHFFFVPGNHDAKASATRVVVDSASKAEGRNDGGCTSPWPDASPRSRTSQPRR
jgi:hypothetical protein